ncbi:MAG: peptide deformylase [Armatimonadetes bacterium]|nr:peptide deformylase [Armatimonadota bacterium]
MARREIVLYPDPRLKAVCPPVAEIDQAARQVARDLQDTLAAMPGTGIAAPQIGELTRIVFIDSSRSEKYAEYSHGPLVLLNPVIVERSGTKRFREGCLSLPEFTAQVKRAKRITVEYLDLAGQPGRLEVEGFEAVLLQHEIDHLDGILFIDRVEEVGSRLLPRDEASE